MLKVVYIIYNKNRLFHLTAEDLDLFNIASYSEDTMIIDTHMHEKTYSDDSFMSLSEIVEKARAIGLDGVCITDHESNGLREFAAEYSRKTGFVIIVGAEILTHEGDVTVFGLDSLPTEKIHAQQLVDMTLKAGGVAMSAHPFRQNNRGMGHSIRKVRGLSGIEAFNGSTPMHLNMQAYQLAAELGIPTFGASDAHVVEKIGKYATVFPGRVRDARDFIEAVKSGVTCPTMYTENGFERFRPFSIPAASAMVESYPALAI